jgi:hypothetical protein
MPELDWEPLDFLQCLGTAPETSEWDTDMLYKVEQSGVTLDLVVWPNESVVSVSLTLDNQSKPMTSFTVLVSGRVLYKNEKWGEYLIFCDCVVVPSRWYYSQHNDVFDNDKYPKRVDMELSVYPTIRIEFE